MTEQKKPKKISRRDAIKLLGAATGATILANLPSKWNTPEIAKGVLPAHAQTSSSLFTIDSCGINQIQQCSSNFASSVVISDTSGGVPMNWEILNIDNATVLAPASLTGTANTVGDTATLLLQVTWNDPSGLIVRWTFANSNQGTGFCQQFFFFDEGCL